MNKFLTLNGLSHFLDKIKGIFVGAASDTTEGHIVTFGANGKTIVDSGHTIAADVPADAVFTDTTYTAATATADGLMSKDDKSKVDGVEAGAQANVIESVQVNGTALEVTSKGVNIDLSGYTPVSALAEYAKKTDITAVFRYKGTVATYSALPTDAEVGDVYNITAADQTNHIKAGDNVVWNGTEWDNLSGILEMDITEISNDEIDTLFA